LWLQGEVVVQEGLAGQQTLAVLVEEQEGY
jgi:hypothetical protein